MLCSDYDSGTGLKNTVVIEDCVCVFFFSPTSLQCKANKEQSCKTNSILKTASSDALYASLIYFCVNLNHVAFIGNDEVLDSNFMPKWQFIPD